MGGIMLDTISLIGGLVLLIAGGEGLIRGAVLLARRLGVSPLIIGLTIVGFGTSAPELLVSVLAATKGAPGLAIGNVVGSNLANMMLIIGLAALMFPLAVHRDALRRDGLVMLLATVAFVAIGESGRAEFSHGVIMLAALTLYVLGSLWSDRRRSHGASAELHREEAESFDGMLPDKGWAIALAIVGGIAGLAVGAHFVVTGASALAARIGMSDEIIGLSVVAVGTSLPELAAAIAAARARQADVCVGNVIGSNIFNLLGIAGTAALFAPLPFSPEMVSFDLWVLLAVSVLLFFFMATGQLIRRWEGALMLLLYAAYMGWHFIAKPVGAMG
jgi:cation:H+ antiporter